jgi:hypothetical protein
VECDGANGTFRAVMSKYVPYVAGS